ncbi:MAG TPA: hypothetical protein VK629_13615 [Steroidobacteraceae bacterium]|nr:hypothetical protein [Steroidobacteraceae bacterium]
MQLLYLHEDAELERHHQAGSFLFVGGRGSAQRLQFATKSGHHLFCRHCGVRSFGRGYIEEMGGAYVSIQLGALDNAEPQELIDAPVKYFDGRHNNWWHSPAETRHL